MTITANSLPVNPNTSTATVGKDYILSVNTGTFATPVWTPVGGQRNSKLSQKADEIDVTDKTTGGWAAKLAGMKSWSIDLSGLVMLNNDGCTAIGVAFRASETVDLKFQYPDKTYQRGWAAVTEFSYDVPHDGAAQLSGTLSGNGELSDITKDTTTGA